MIIERDTRQYSLYEDETIHKGLKRIVDNRAGIVFIVDGQNHLKGLFTNGDFLRWVVAQSIVDLDQPVSVVANHDYIYSLDTDEPESIQAHLKRVNFVPIIDANNHLVAVARHRTPEIRIDHFVINDDSPTFIIAEIGNNHNGSLERAIALIDAAAAAGVDCAKFQMRDLETLYYNAGDADDARENLGSQYTLDLLTRFELAPEDMYKAFDHCKSVGVIPLCTPWDFKSLERLEAYGMPAYKVASADLTNHELLKAITHTGKPMICSTGMSDEDEIRQSVEILQRFGAQYILLQCNSTYPAPFKDIHLRYLSRLTEIGDCHVGYSGHERGYHVAVASVAMGAKVVEKHFTFDRSMEGNDHKVSLLPDELKAMVKAIRDVEDALGSSAPRQITQGEMMNRATLSKSLIASQNIKQGQIIKRDMIMVRSPGRGLQPNYLSDLVGQPATRNMTVGDFFYRTDLDDEIAKPKPYQFQRPWGIPVRYHDYREFTEATTPDLLEFHLSYKDLSLSLSHFFDETHNIELIVHAPELFANDHTLDLCTADTTYRQQSIANLQHVIDITRHLNAYFPQTHRPLIIVNVGGFTDHEHLPPYETEQLYDNLLISLSQLDAEGVELIPQTMPPFPWHFGGQRYHNVFVSPEDITRFCKDYAYRICLDVSHSKLACNYFDWSFKQFIDQVGPYVAHLHLVDAEGIDSEGLQIGTGDIDFAALAEQLKRVAPKASFIPEIWQGHENNGAGFWTALNRLEEWF